MIDFGMATNIGDCKINEDCADAFVDGEVKVFAMADGLGGHGGGDIASHLVVETVMEIISNESRLKTELLNKCFDLAQERLLSNQKELHREGAMKTTLVLLLTDGQNAVWAHIGDSRLYYCKRNRVKFRTLDHSVPQMLVNLKKISEKDIRHHNERSVLLKVMGIPWSDGQMYEIDEKKHRLKKGDSFLMCSDGLWEWIEDKDISRIICQKKSANDIANELVDEAYSNGLGTERDNLTALVVKVI